MSGAGRFAPSPTGTLHLGNLRTALAAWLFARSTGRRFVLRFEDLDGSASPEHEASQRRDLERLGLTWDPTVDGADAWRQSDRLEVYAEVLDRLRSDGALYPCFCSRREIREAVAAPNGPPPIGEVPYPGTCRDLDGAARARREAETGRPPSWRVRAEGRTESFDDLVVGPTTAEVDDFVVQRFDGTPAYNLVVVVDDAAQGVDQVVRADDLVTSTPRQIVVHDLLGLDVPTYAHVPLVLSPASVRLAKRDGAVTLDERLDAGDSIEDVLAWMTRSLGLPETRSAEAALASFDPGLIGRAPTVFDGGSLSSASRCS